MHQHPPFTNYVLSANIGDHTVDFARAAAPGKIHPVYHGSGSSVRRHNYHNSKCSLQKAEHPQDGAVGAELFYQKRSETASDESAERPLDGNGRQQNATK